jgi:PST family polysaccharide transporter
MDLKKTTFLSAISTAVRMVGGIVTTKVAAYFLGPSGVAFVGQFQNLMAFILSGSNLGIGHGVIKYLSDGSQSLEAKKSLLSTAFCISFCTSLVTSMGILIFHGEISRYLFKSNDYGEAVLLMGLAVSLIGLTQLMLQALNGFRQVRSMIIAKILASVLGVIATVALIYLKGIHGALLAITVVQLIGFIVTVYFSSSKYWFSREFLLQGFHSASAAKLSKYALMTFTSVLLLNIRQLYLRDYIIVNLSSDTAGIWQAVWKISDMFVSLITFSLSVYYLPKLSSISVDKELRSEIYKVYKFLLPIIILISLSIFLLRDFILAMLYTSDFIEARELFSCQLLGDGLKISSWLISFLMVAKAMYRTYIITEVLFSFMYICSSIVLVDGFGVIGTTYAHLLTYLFYFISMCFMFRRVLFNKSSL